jgi:hypothetical protein
MITIERRSGQAVRIGPHVVRVVVVQPGRVVVALLDTRHDCATCGRRLVAGRCPACRPAFAALRPGRG